VSTADSAPDTRRYHRCAKRRAVALSLAIARCAWVLLLTMLLREMSAKGASRWAAPLASLRAILVWPLMLAAFAQAPRDWQRLASRRCLIRSLVLLVLTLSGSVLGLNLPLDGVFSSVMVAVLLLAALEEILFRGVMPVALSEFLMGGGLTKTWALMTAQGLAQATFALAHLLPRNPVESWPIEEFLRLLAAGFCYSILATNTGLWLAIAVHTLNNFLVSMPGRMVHAPPPRIELVALVAIAAGALLVRKRDVAEIHSEVRT